MIDGFSCKWRETSSCHVVLRFGALFLVLTLLGCGSGSPIPTARVTGTITTPDGKPVENGRIIFGPLDVKSSGLSGKAARGNIENGKFELTTYNRGDGAVIGKHRVALKELSNFDDEMIKEYDLPPKHGCKISPEFQEVEVVSGKNFFEFVAIPRSKEENRE